MRKKRREKRKEKRIEKDQREEATWLSKSHMCQHTAKSNEKPRREKASGKLKEKKRKRERRERRGFGFRPVFGAVWVWHGVWGDADA
jgi:hypothetical protein